MIYINDDVNGKEFIQEATAFLELRHPYLQEIYGIKGDALNRPWVIIHKLVELAKSSESVDIYRTSENKLVMAFVDFAEVLNAVSVGGLRATKFDRPPKRTFSCGQILVSELIQENKQLQRRWKVYTYKEYETVKEKLRENCTTSYWLRVKAKGRPATKTREVEEC